MTVTTLLTTESIVGDALRREVRSRVEEEHARLREVERPELLAQFDAAAESELPALGRAIAILNYRIAALTHELDTVHEPHPDSAVCPSCCVQIDRGDGAHWFLLAALDERGLPVIAHDSGLGRALIGARPGQDVVYPDPAGARAVHVLAMA
ncbi:hypothetical protein [Sporichthya polymorpha]|uniref:hypothetical protein n=1 Tax=Sporichthya polymorpha TaxID=35751 RepID=UPI00036FFD0D|nr:hypothetical protein [Sporichthya polymorpha]